MLISISFIQQIVPNQIQFSDWEKSFILHAQQSEQIYQSETELNTEYEIHSLAVFVSIRQLTIKTSS